MMTVRRKFKRVRRRQRRQRPFDEDDIIELASSGDYPDHDHNEGI